MCAKKRIARIYKDEYPDMLIEAFDIEPYEEHTMKSKSGEILTVKRVANPVPWLTKVVWDKFGISKDTFYRWMKKTDENKAPMYPLLIEAWDIAKGLQEYIIAVNGLLGLYNAGFSQFTLKNTHLWRDKAEILHSGSLSVDSLMNTVAKNSKDKSMIDKE